MFCVNIALGNTVWRLLYRNEEKAKADFTMLEHAKLGKEPARRVTDDFGQEFSGGDQIAALMFEDLDKAKMANVELFLHQQRTQALATKAAQSDPGLRASSAMSSPRVLDPMGRFQQ
jgi:hypothetical protein